jgi:hypothetical protein
VQKCKSTYIGLLTNAALTASLGSVTGILHCTGDCAYDNDFPSQFKTPTWANWGPLKKQRFC